SGLDHEGKQADGFKGHRLAAGIRPRDDQCCEPVPYPQVDGNDGPAVKEGMPAFFDVYPFLPVEFRADAIEIKAEPCLGKCEIQLCEQIYVSLQRFDDTCDFTCQFLEYPLYFLLFLYPELLYVVVGFDDCHRLDIYRGSAGRRIVHQAG